MSQPNPRQNPALTTPDNRHTNHTSINRDDSPAHSALAHPTRTHRPIRAERVTSTAPPASTTEHTTCTGLLRRSQRIKNKSNNEPLNPIKATNQTIPKRKEPSNQSQTPPSSSQQTPSPRSPLTSPNTKPNPSKNKNRKRDVVFWNPPFNRNLKTNIGKQFLSLLNKHFPVNNELSSIINRSTVKIAYSNTPSISQIITTHNKKILNKRKPKPQTKPCNCTRQICPLPGKCREETVIYKATVKDGAFYVGMTQNEFKERAGGHKQSFTTEYKEHATALSSYIWDKKINRNENDEIIEPRVKWNIIKKCSIYKPGSKHCDLCLSEKLFIILNSPNPKCINKKQDIVTKCKHKNLYFYKSIENQTQPDVT